MVMQPLMRTKPYGDTQAYVRAEHEVRDLQLTDEETAYVLRHVCLYAPREVLTALQVIKHDRSKAAPVSYDAHVPMQGPPPS